MLNCFLRFLLIVISAFKTWSHSYSNCADVYKHNGLDEQHVHFSNVNEIDKILEMKNRIRSNFKDQNNNRRFNNNFTLVSYASDGILDYSKYSFFLLEQYARMHDYDVKLLSTSDVLGLNRALNISEVNKLEYEMKMNSVTENEYDVNDFRWNKVNIMLKMIEHHQHQTANLNPNLNGLYASEIFNKSDETFFVWIDADAIIMDFHLELQDIIYSYSYSYNNTNNEKTNSSVIDGPHGYYSNIYISEDFDRRNGIANTGLMIIKSCPWSIGFLTRWWMDYNHQDGMDQFAFTHLYNALIEELIHDGSQYGMDITHYISILPVHVLNSRVPARKYQVATDGILHLAGEMNSYRKSVFKYAVMQYCKAIGDYETVMSDTLGVGKDNTTLIVNISRAILQSLYYSQFVSVPEDHSDNSSITTAFTTRSALIENIVNATLLFHASFVWDVNVATTPSAMDTFKRFVSDMRSRIRDLMQVDRHFMGGVDNAMYIASNIYVDQMSAMALMTLYDMSRRYVSIMEQILLQTDSTPSEIPTNSNIEKQLLVEFKQLKIDICFDIITLPSSTNEMVIEPDPSQISYLFENISFNINQSRVNSDESYVRSGSLHSLKHVFMLLYDVSMDIDQLIHLFESKYSPTGQSKSQSRTVGILYYYKFKHFEFLSRAYRKSCTLWKQYESKVGLNLGLRLNADMNLSEVYYTHYITNLNHTCTMWLKLHEEFAYYGTGNTLTPIQSYIEGVLLMQELGLSLCNDTTISVSNNIQNIQNSLYWISYALHLLEIMKSSVSGSTTTNNDSNSIYVEYLNVLYFEISQLYDFCSAGAGAGAGAVTLSMSQNALDLDLSGMVYSNSEPIPGFIKDKSNADSDVGHVNNAKQSHKSKSKRWRRKKKR